MNIRMVINLRQCATHNIRQGDVPLKIKRGMMLCSVIAMMIATVRSPNILSSCLFFRLRRQAFYSSLRRQSMRPVTGLDGSAQRLEPFTYSSSFASHNTLFCSGLVPSVIWAPYVADIASKQGHLFAGLWYLRSTDSRRVFAVPRPRHELLARTRGPHLTIL